MISRALIALVVIGVIVALVLLGRGPALPGMPGTLQRPAAQPGYAARDAELIETGDDGRPLYTLNAALIRQHPNDDRVQLDAPRMVVVDPQGNTWHVQAQSGQIRDDGASVDLVGDVHVKGELPGAEVPPVFDTSRLSFDARSQTVFTDAPVTLDWNGRKLDAVGLVAKLNEHEVRLESRVHGSFPPK